MISLTNRHFTALLNKKYFEKTASQAEKRVFNFFSNVEKGSLNVVKTAVEHLNKTEKPQNVCAVLGRARLIAQSQGDKDKEDFLLSTLDSLLQETGRDKRTFFRDLYSGRIVFEKSKREKVSFGGAKIALLLLMGAVSSVAANQGLYGSAVGRSEGLQAMAYPHFEWEAIEKALKHKIMSNSVEESDFSEGIEFLGNFEKSNSCLPVFRKLSQLQTSNHLLQLVERMIDNAHTVALRVLHYCGFNFNQLLPSGKTPLGLAAEKGSGPTVRALIDSGADCNMQDQWQLTPLFRTLNSENYSLSSDLIQGGADFRLNDETLLHYFAKNDRIEQIKFLVQQGANVNALANDTSTPLHSAAFKGRQRSMELLLKLGADANIIGSFDATTPLCLFKNKHTYQAPQALVKADKKCEKILAFKFLVHAWELENSMLLGDMLFPAPSGVSSVLSRQMTSIFNDYTKFFPGTLNSIETRKIMTFFNDANTPHSTPPFTTAAYIRNRGSVTLSTGFIGHTVFVIFEDNYFVIANKGWASRFPIEAYEIDRSLVTTGDIQRLAVDFRHNDVSWYETWLNEFPGKFNSRRTSLFYEIDATYPYRRYQIRENCAYESQETALFALLSIMRKSAGAALPVFVNWVQFNQALSLKRFFNTLGSETLLQNKRLLSEVFTVYQKESHWHPKLKNWIDGLEEYYMALFCQSKNLSKVFQSNPKCVRLECDEIVST